MKKILLLVTAFLLISVHGFAQFGIKAGYNFNSIGDINTGKDATYKTAFNKKTGFHAGVLYKFKIPVIGLTIQPELIYSQVKSSFAIDKDAQQAIKGDMSIDYLQLPVGLQFGLDLMLFRPFIQIVPYVGYSIGDKLSANNMKWDVEKFNCGMGLGAGLDIWKLQISGRYNWDFGKVAQYEWSGLKSFKGGKNKGFQLSLAFLF